MAFVPLEKLINISEGYRQSFSVAQHQIQMVCQDQQLLIFENLCPHKQHSLTNASIEHGNIRCPGHGLEFSLKNFGKCVSPNAQCEGLRLFKVVYEGSQVGINLTE